MKIETHTVDYPLDFGVNVQRYVDSSQLIIEKITLMIKGAMVTLSYEESNELLKVLAGRDAVNLNFFEDKNDQHPHTIISSSYTSDQQPGNVELVMSREFLLKDFKTEEPLIKE
jgi:hypothetical protein